MILDKITAASIKKNIYKKIWSKHVCVRARVCVGHFVFFANNQNQCDFFYLHEGDQRRDLPLPELGLKPKSLAWGLDMSTP